MEFPTELNHPLHPSFFTGLDVPWLRLTTLDAATAVTPQALDASALQPPPADDPQLGQDVWDSADALLTQGATLQSILTGNHVLRKRLFEEATGNASYDASVTPYLALTRMRETERWVRTNLDAVSLAAPQSVTLASSSGRFSVIVSNELDVPVTVTVRAQAERGLTITGGEPIQLSPTASRPCRSTPRPTNAASTTSGSSSPTPTARSSEHTTPSRCVPSR